MFSVITINLNNKDGLERTIKSVVNQTFKEFEYIIIDGNSNDGSIEIIKKYQKSISYWKSEPDKGIYSAMNKGVNVAKGKYCIFINSGDYLIDNKVLESVRNYQLEEDIVCGNLLWKSSKKEFLDIPVDVITFEHFFRASIPHPASFIKRELFNSVGLYNENLKIVGDWEFFLRAFFKNYCSYRHINVTVAVFNIGGISSDKNSVEYLRFERKKVLQEMFPLFYEDYSDLIFYRNSIIVKFAKSLHLFIRDIILKFRSIKKLLIKFLL